MFTSKLTDTFVMRQLVTTEMLDSAISSFITLHISDSRQFSDIHISQGSVATYVRCGEIFKNEFVGNLPLSLSLKESRKSVNIWGSYGQEFSAVS